LRDISTAHDEKGLIHKWSYSVFNNITINYCRIKELGDED